MILLTSSLAHALRQLRRNTLLPQSDLAVQFPELVETFQTAAIKSFEYAYEMAIRLLRRALEETAASPPDIDRLEFKAIIRLAAERGLIDDPAAWFVFRLKRNITSHTYDAAQAREVLAVMPEFLLRAEFLLSRLEDRTHAPA